MTQPLTCWKCGAALVDLPLPLGRREACPACDADLHVCRMCVFFDPSVSDQCREPVAERVNDKARANFCGYLEPRANAHVPPDDTEAHAARAGLAALFGDSDSQAAQGAGRSEADEARDALDDLFGLRDGKE